MQVVVRYKNSITFFGSHYVIVCLTRGRRRHILYYYFIYYALEFNNVKSYDNLSGRLIGLKHEFVS